ncbi:helix-turn-helix domain-containing protein [Myroides sp. C15-4]|uniref:helix-turn-helix domain-containing protein n=1 Tax=Myroides sp. C15-4 TaxID=3400532 RepID=UPI003D2F98D1
MEKLDKKQPIQLISNEQMIDRFIGEVGTREREDFDASISIDKLAMSIRQLRKEKNLTQSQLGELVGVKKAQISRIESSTLNIGLFTLHKVFQALGAKITFNVENDITLNV